MTTYCEVVGNILHPLSPGDEVQPQFDISTWLDTDAISSVTFSATDEAGSDVSATALDAGKNAYTTSVLKPWIKGAATDDKRYTVKMTVTTVNGEIMTFYIKYGVRNIGNET